MQSTRREMSMASTVEATTPPMRELVANCCAEFRKVAMLAERLGLGLEQMCRGRVLRSAAVVCRIWTWAETRELG